jgi:hypothetical protein
MSCALLELGWVWRGRSWECKWWPFDSSSFDSSDLAWTRCCKEFRRFILFETISQHSWERALALGSVRL